MASTDALAKMIVTISANTADFAKSLQTTQSKISAFAGQVGKIAGVLGIAFGVSQVASFVKEISILAGQAEGVRGAFDRLKDSAKVLDGLKEATGNTVSELELMKAAVQANNFQIPVENLAKLFQFATLRAQQTGQSVDFLVQSIVTGIGRKSPLILDNLGISAVRLRDKLKGVGTETASVGDVAKVVGTIAEEELGNMAAFSDNAATKTQKLSASWEDLKVALGKASNSSGVLGDALDDISTIVRGLTILLNSDASNALSNYIRLATIVPRTTLNIVSGLVEIASHQDTLTESVQKFNDKLKEAPFFNFTGDGIRALNDLRKMADEVGKKLVLLSDNTGRTLLLIKDQVVTTNNLTAANEKLAITFDSLQDKLKGLNEDFEKTEISDQKNLETLGRKIIAIDAQIKKLDELRKANKDQVSGLAEVRAKLEDVNKTIEKTALTDEVRLRNLRLEKAALEGLIKTQERLNQSHDNSNLLTENILPTSVVKITLESMDKIIDRIKNIRFELKKVGDTSIEIGGIISGAIFSMADAFGSLTQKSFNFGQAILEVAANFAQQFGAILIAAGIAKISFDKFSGPAMIVAGAALVALGAAAKGVIANRPNLSSSSSSGSGATSNSANFTNGANGGLISIIGDGEWRISGRDLVFVYDKNKGLDGSRRG